MHAISHPPPTVRETPCLSRVRGQIQLGEIVGQTDVAGIGAVEIGGPVEEPVHLLKGTA